MFKVTRWCLLEWRKLAFLLVCVLGMFLMLVCCKSEPFTPALSDDDRSVLFSHRRCSNIGLHQGPQTRSQCFNTPDGIYVEDGGVPCNMVSGLRCVSLRLNPKPLKMAQALALQSLLSAREIAGTSPYLDP